MEEKDYDKLTNDPQILLYYYAISKMFPEYAQSIMTIFYIKDGGIDGAFKVHGNKQDRPEFDEISSEWTKSISEAISLSRAYIQGQ